MILIDDKIIADDILTEQFYCNLKACKGQCCVEGVCGAPLEQTEKQYIADNFKHIKHLLSKEALQVIEQKGFYEDLQEHGLVTPTIGDGICVYGIHKKGVVYCAFEQVYLENKSTWKKPISCHLFPIRIQKTDLNEIWNYEKINICNAACSYGTEKNITVFEFLKEAIIRKAGIEFYSSLEKIKIKYKL